MSRKLALLIANALLLPVYIMLYIVALVGYALDTIWEELHERK